jgi:hypothetical protein
METTHTPTKRGKYAAIRTKGYNDGLSGTYSNPYSTMRSTFAGAFMAYHNSYHDGCTAARRQGLNK